MHASARMQPRWPKKLEPTICTWEIDLKTWLLVSGGANSSMQRTEGQHEPEAPLLLPIGLIGSVQVIVVQIPSFSGTISRAAQDLFSREGVSSSSTLVVLQPWMVRKRPITKDTQVNQS